MYVTDGGTNDICPATIICHDTTFAQHCCGGVSSVFFVNIVDQLKNESQGEDSQARSIRSGVAGGNESAVLPLLPDTLANSAW